MDKKTLVYIHNRILFSHKEDSNCVICRKIDGTRDRHVKQNEPGSERQILHVFCHMQNLDLKNDMCIKGEVGGTGRGDRERRGQWMDEYD
jgi:hypothetical protein